MRFATLKGFLGIASWVGLLLCTEAILPQSHLCWGGQVGSLVLMAYVPPRINFKVDRGLTSASFYSHAGAQGTEVFRMVEAKNQMDPEIITVSSANHANLNAENGKSINYGITYNNTPLDLKSGSQRWMSPAHVKEHVLNINFVSPGNQQTASHPYRDIVTFTISTL